MQHFPSHHAARRPCRRRRESSSALPARGEHIKSGLGHQVSEPDRRCLCRASAPETARCVAASAAARWGARSRPLQPLRTSSKPGTADEPNGSVRCYFEPNPISTNTQHTSLPCPSTGLDFISYAASTLAPVQPCTTCVLAAHLPGRIVRRGWSRAGPGVGGIASRGDQNSVQMRAAYTGCLDVGPSGLGSCIRS